jgi:hypothetical protein
MGSVDPACVADTVEWNFYDDCEQHGGFDDGVHHNHGVQHNHDSDYDNSHFDSNGRYSSTLGAMRRYG